MLDPSEKRNKPQERVWYQPAFDLIQELKPQNVCDLGCGLCEFAVKIRNRFPKSKIFCVDGSPKYVENAINLGFDAIRADLNEKLPFDDAKFDLVVCLEVIEHIEKAEQLLFEINRILKKDGLLLISTPNYAYFNVRLKILLGKPIPDEGYHFRFFTYNLLKEKLKEAGFKIYKENCVSFLPLYKIKFIPSEKILTFKIPIMKNLLASKIIILARK